MNTVVRILLIATLIALSGMLALKLAVPPGYASPLWPPAGVALAALLLWGTRMWPAVLLGALSINVLNAAGAGQLHATTALMAIGIACGSTLQALAAAALSSRYVARGVPDLDSPKSILRFILLCGPLACLIAATIGILSLTLAGIQPVSTTLFPWWNWWIGDSLGVIIFTPLAFCLLASAPLWKRRRLQVGLPLLLTLALIITVFAFTLRSEQTRVQLTFDKQATAIKRSLVEYATNILDSTGSLRDLYAASAEVNRSEFSVFTTGILKRHPEIRVMQWLPRVTLKNLAAFERTVQHEGYPGFRVTEKSGNDMIPARSRPEYFPVLFNEPMAGNERAFGFDSISNPASLESKQRARISLQPSVTRRMTLAQMDTPEAAVLVAIPIPEKSGNAGQSDIAGFIQSVVLPATMVDVATRGMDVELLGIALRDLNAPPQEAWLYMRETPYPLPGDAISPLRHTFSFGDRPWEIIISPDQRFLVMHGSSLPWITLVGGLVFTGLLSIYLLTLSGREAFTEQLVETRTRELRANEWRLNNILDSLSAYVYIKDLEGRYTYINRMLADLWQTSPAEAIGRDDSAFFDVTTAAKLRDNDLRVLVGGETLRTEETNLVATSGVTGTYLSIKLPLRDENGRIYALLGISTDITDRKRMEEKLAESEARFRMMFDLSPDPIFIVSLPEGRFIDTNEAASSKLEYSREELLQLGPAAIDTPEFAARVPERNKRLMEGGGYVFETAHVSKSGRAIPIEISAKILELHNQPVILAIARDITERKLAEEKLSLFARVFAEAHEGIIITGADGNIIDVNPTFCEITGYSREEIIGQNPRIIGSGKQSPEFYAAMWKAITADGHWQGEIWNRRKDGELFAELLTISTLRDEKDNILHYVGLFSDITHTKHQQQALELMAHYDALTKLPNRVLFADRFNQAIARARRDDTLLALCYLDLDGFKQINDSLGHDAGDQLLVEVAERIKSSLREEDTVSRLGGDEFALLIGDIRTLEQCEQALSRIHRAVSQPYLIAGQSAYVSASTGVTIYPQDESDPDALLRHADQAMYQAKQSGRNRYHLFDAHQDQQIRSQRQQLDTIETAFHNDEFCLYYQPKVNMGTGEVIGAEALIRWNHPERGLIPPGEFLPLLEGTALDPILGDWVVEQALRQLDAWHSQGLDLQVSVNISPFHLQQVDFFSKLDAALARHPDIASRQLQLEILESNLLGDISSAGDVIRACRDALGVSIALDDFGTGYSSLAYLRRLPANTIKIDQSFVRDMIDDPNDYAIVQGVIGLANAFRRETVAEGVETREHGLMLLTMNCTLAQGYGIARPMPAENLAEWMKNYRPDESWVAYISTPQPAHDTQLLLLRIENGNWVSRIEACLDARHEGAPHWPIMDHEKCHCGQWLIRARNARLFDPVMLARLSQEHIELHRTGNHLMQLYLAGKAEQARAGLAQLRAVHEKTVAIIDSL